MKRVRIATRRSRLAMAQSRLVAEAIGSANPAAEVELVLFTTPGDSQAGPLAAAGGKGMFTAELEAALRDRRVDLAVHSAKDMPADMPDDLTLAAVPKREDPRDALFCPGGASLEQLPPGAVVGTGSPRRRAQLLAVRGDLDVVAVRGSVETRVNKAVAGHVNAVVLAMAGLKRSGLADAQAGGIFPLAVEAFVPAAGQGALAIQALAANEQVAALLAPVEDPPSRAALLAERAVVRALGADCRSCLAVHVAPVEAGWCGVAMAARPDGSDLRRFRTTAAEAGGVATALIRQMRARGVERDLR